MIYVTIGITSIKIKSKCADSGINYAKKCFIILTLGANVIKLFSMQFMLLLVYYLKSLTKVAQIMPKKVL